jgi:hypothetical protein
MCGEDTVTMVLSSDEPVHGHFVGTVAAASLLRRSDE